MTRTAWYNMSLVLAEGPIGGPSREGVRGERVWHLGDGECEGWVYECGHMLQVRYPEFSFSQLLYELPDDPSGLILVDSPIQKLLGDPQEISVGGHAITVRARKLSLSVSGEELLENKKLASDSAALYFRITGKPRTLQLIRPGSENSIESYHFFDEDDCILHVVTQWV